LSSRIMEDALHKEGFEVIIAHDGKGGLLKAGEYKPDLIILDLVLPDMPGEQVCRDLKRHPDTEQTPLMMVTGKDSDVDRVVGKVLGAEAYISKPFNISNLLAEIKKLIVCLIICLCTGWGYTCAQDTNDTQVPEGMELIKVGEHSIFVAQGTKITKRGAQLVLEPQDEFVARKLLSLEEKISALKQQQDLLLQRVDALNKTVEQLRPLKSIEVEPEKTTTQ